MKRNVKKDLTIVVITTIALCGLLAPFAYGIRGAIIPICIAAYAGLERLFIRLYDARERRRASTN